MSFSDLLIHTVDIETVTNDYQTPGDGSPDKDWAAASIDDKDVPCRRVDLKGTLKEAIAGRNEESTHKFLFKSDVTISPGQQLNEDGTYYIVTFVGRSSTRILHHKTVYAKLIQRASS